VPPLLVALAAIVLFFVREVVIRRAPPRRPARPRPIVLPTWRPGWALLIGRSAAP